MIQQQERIRDWLDQGWALLSRGAASQAGDVFERVLLLDPASQEARRGAERAETLCREATRLWAERLAEAEAAAVSGDGATARGIAEDVIAQGGDRDRAHALLDRLDRREAHRELPVALAVPVATTRTEVARPRSRVWTRKALLGGWAMLFALLLAGVASSFEGLLARLERAPLPASFTLPPTTALPASTLDEQTVVAARRLLDRGDAAGAVVLLRRVKPAEPAYPFAQQLLGQAQNELDRRGSR